MIVQEAQAEQADLMARMVRACESLGSQIQRLPRALFVFLAACLLVIRDGAHVFGEPWADVQKRLESFPTAVSWQSESWGNLTLAKALHVSTPTQWTLLHAALTLVAVLLPVVFVWRWPRGRFEVFVLFWFLFPVVGSLLMWVGFYDVMFVLGAVIVALARHWWMVLLGAVVMSSGNPEQAIAASAIFLLVTLSSIAAERRRHALIALVVVLLAFIPVRMWMGGQSVPSRSGLLRPPLVGVRELINGWPATVWGWYGILWFVLLAVLLAVTWRSRTILVAALVVVPVAITFVTSDWFRVYWLVTTIGLLVVGAAVIRRMGAPTYTGLAIVGGTASLILVPTVGGGLFFLLSSIGDVVLR